MFQQADAYGAPVWPPAEGEQRPMMHFDFQVGNPDAANFPVQTLQQVRDLLCVRRRRTSRRQ
ncbi:hypothetical protein [Streptomyces sp. NBC_00063]|uniref:hypothetical protein n=1 Tax=Streptomyces sp. NBC_00063 TaxID=2975638 RepID=UPI003D72EED7